MMKTPILRSVAALRSFVSPQVYQRSRCSFSSSPSRSNLENSLETVDPTFGSVLSLMIGFNIYVASETIKYMNEYPTLMREWVEITQRIDERHGMEADGGVRVADGAS